MGCGSSGHVVAPAEANEAQGKVEHGNGASNGHHHNRDDHHHHRHEDHHHDGENGDNLSTVVLPESPKPKPPVAYEIPLEEFDGNTKRASTPPPHLQRLLLHPAAEITLPDIREKLAEAEQRRLLLLQQRAASAQKRSQRMTKSFNDNMKMEHEEATKHNTNVVTITPEPVEDKNI